MPDTQVRYALTRACLTFGPIVHIMRSVPPELVRRKAWEYDVLIRSALADLLGLPVVPFAAWEQASLGVRLGGLGLRSCERHLEAAFIGGCHQGAREDGWVLEADVAYMTSVSTFMARFPGPGVLPGDSQKDLSCLIEWDQFSSLIDSFLPRTSDPIALAVADYHRGRLFSVAKPEAGVFWNAIPSKVLNLDIAPAYFTVIAKWWLGLEIYPEAATCRKGNCANTCDRLGLHALTCMCGGNHGVRHHAIRNIIHDVALRGGITCAKERSIGFEGRPADVWLDYPGFLQAIDVAITHPLQSIYLAGVLTSTIDELKSSQVGQPHQRSGSL